MKRFILPALILAPLALAGVAIAGSHGQDGSCERGGPGGHFRGHRGPPIERIASHLDLDEGQVAELEGLRDSVFGDEDPREAHKALRETLAAELSNDAPDFEKLVSLATAEAEARHARHLDAIQGMADFAETLTPEQRALVAGHLEKGPPHGRHHR
ncbi:MAG: periplasmic heavy metal sensor [Proteobacteria bacterium]|nr:periplasmic heavy metal sensor [Pseudomonadota bacterium]